MLGQFLKPFPELYYRLNYFLIFNPSGRTEAKNQKFNIND